MPDDDEVATNRARHGDVIAGNYVLGERIGQGGMGTVYLALQRSLDRMVAIKLPRADLRADPAVRRRLAVEARAGARVVHPNTVRVLEFGDDGNTPYLVMEHVSGPSLGQFVAERGMLPIESASDLVCQLLAGLEEAHACGVLHADIKCDNVLVETSRDGRAMPRLIDFGLARFIDAPVSYPDDTERVVSGTPEYLAPELIRGEAPTIASDLYAVAIVLYELVTGDTPFAGGTSGEVMSRHLDHPHVPMSWRRLNGDTTAALEEVVARALAKSPSARFPDARAFRTALVRATCLEAPASPEAAGGTRPSWLWCETPTVSLEPTPADAATTASSAVPLPASSVETRRHALALAVERDDPDAIALAYLELARAHVDAHELPLALAELEAGVTRLRSHVPACASMWLMLLTLAALYDGCGQRARARRAALSARVQAIEAGSTLGAARADRLVARLGGRPATHDSGD